MNQSIYCQLFLPKLTTYQIKKQLQNTLQLNQCINNLFKLKINQFKKKICFPVNIDVLPVIFQCVIPDIPKFGKQQSNRDKENFLYMECKYNWEQNELRTKTRKKKYRENSYTIYYPTDKIRQMRFSSSEEISTFLLKNAVQIGYCKWQLFEKSIVDKGDYIKIVYTCRKQFCNAILIYHQKKPCLGRDDEKQMSQNFHLTEYQISNKHEHVLKLTPKIASQQNIRQYLFDLPVQQKFESHVETIKQKFNLTKCQTRYLKDRVFWKFKDEDHMLRKLSERKVLFRRKIQGGRSTILILVSQSMKRNYIRYGDSICFDVTYKLLKKKRGQAKHLGVGFFIGQDQNCRIVLFAFSTIQHQTSEDFQILFEFFFQIVEHPPQSIITDDQRAIGIAIQRIKAEKKYEYIHFLDWYHKMQALKRVTRRESNKDQVCLLFSRLLKEPSRKCYIDIMYQIAEMLDKQSIMKQFLKQQKKYCLSNAHDKFFGFGISSTRAESFNGLIKKSVPHQTNLGKLIYFVLRVQKRLLNRMAVLNFMHQQVTKNMMADQELDMLSQNLQHLAFQQIRQYMFESRELDGIYNGSSPVNKVVEYRKYDRKYKFNLMYDLKYDCWRCECRNNFRTGMPCSHLFRVVKLYKGCISYYINQRWLHKKQNAHVRKPSRPSNKHKKI